MIRARWFVPTAVWALMLAASCRGQAATTQQDTWAGVERIVAVGDVHGDCEQLVKVLRAAKVVDDKNQWVAGKTHLVQTGDVLDRGPDSKKAMDLLMDLEEQAAKAGGRVHCLIGNHEAMVPMDDWRYVHPGEKLAFGDAEGAGLRKAMAADGRYGKWIRSHNAVIKINDTLFCHAGLSEKYADKTLGEINAAVRRDIAKGDMDGVAMDEDGPLWNRRLAFGGPTAVADLEAVLKEFGAARIVIGHTFNVAGVAFKADGRIVRIDVGLSSFYKGPAACLVLEKGELFEVRPEKTTKLDPKAASTQESE